MKPIIKNPQIGVAILFVLGSFVLQSDTCSKEDVTNNCHPEVGVETQDKPDWPEFKIKGYGFNPEVNAKVTVHDQPSGLPSNQDIGTVKTDELGGFEIIWHLDAGYLSLPVDTNAKPFFSAADDKGCSGKTITISASFWYQ